MRTLWIVITLALLSPIITAQESDFGPPDRTGWSNLRMIKQICGTCHALEYYVIEPRSFKVVSRVSRCFAAARSLPLAAAVKPIH